MEIPRGRSCKGRMRVEEIDNYRREPKETDRCESGRKMREFASGWKQKEGKEG